METFPRTCREAKWTVKVRDGPATRQGHEEALWRLRLVLSASCGPGAEYPEQVLYPFMHYPILPLEQATPAGLYSATAVCAPT